jgi:NAD-reducing hydrogenase large subunit
VVRAYDPCLSCSSHAADQYPLEIQLVNADGMVVDSMRS